MEKSLKDDWKITTKRFVAYIDIMGFKDMVARNSHSTIYEMMMKIDESKKLNESVDWLENTPNSILVKSTTYSDSIMIYSKDDSFDALDALICTVSGITDDLFIESIPHKGAVAFGLMTLDSKNSIFFGQPLIDAYLLQEELAFYGIIIHSSAQEEIEKKESNDDLTFIVEYTCPLKLGSSKHLTIYPMNTYLDGPEHKVAMDELFESVKKLRNKTSGHLRKYIDNTEVYLAYIRNNKL